MYKVAILVEKELAYSIFREKDLAFLSTFATFNPIDELPEKITPEFMEAQLPDADACITCWRTPTFSKELLDKNPKLRFIMHGAGAVRNLVCPEFWTMQGRHISSNAPVIAEDVAQTTLALILASLKQMWAFNAMTHAGGWKGGEHGTFTTKRLDEMNVGIVGCSLVGKEVIKILRPFNCHLRVWDPYLSPLEAEILHVEQMELDELIATSDVLTMHAPANPDCKNILNAKNIPLIKDGALLVNTARGLAGCGQPPARHGQRGAHAPHRRRTYHPGPEDAGPQHHQGGLQLPHQGPHRLRGAGRDAGAHGVTLLQPQKRRARAAFPACARAVSPVWAAGSR